MRWERHAHCVVATMSKTTSAPETSNARPPTSDIDQQSRDPVRYGGHLIGTLIPDLIVDRSVIVDRKVATAFSDGDLAQVLGYFNITDLRVALLLNFKHRDLRWKRVVVSRLRMSHPCYR